MRPVDAATGERLIEVGTDPIRLELGPLEFRWISLAPAAGDASGA